jgi:hypothetical protein
MLLQQLRADAAVPVVEITGDDERGLRRYRRGDVIEQARGLPLAAGREQAEMHPAW